MTALDGASQPIELRGPTSSISGSRAATGLRTLLRALRRNPLAAICLGFLVLVVMFCWVGPLVYHTDQVHTNLKEIHESPSGRHPLGTDAVGYDARSGALFVFYGRRKDALKILFFDGTGMVIFYKRFDSSVVKLPSDAPPGTQQIELDDAILEALLDGIALEDKPASKRRRAVH